MNCNVKITAVGTADGLEVSIHGGSVGMMTAAELIVAREYEYFDAGLVGHGEGSVIMAQQYIKLTAREIVAIRWHMGAYSGSQDWDTLSAVYDRYPEALCLHFADMIATHYDEVPF